MKKEQLKDIIREEIQNVLKEGSELYSANQLGNAISYKWNPKKGLKDSLALMSMYKSKKSKGGKEKQFTWDEINDFLMARGWSPRHIADILLTLKHVKEGVINERGMWNQDLVRLHKAKDKKEYDTIMKTLNKTAYNKSDAEYMLNKYRKAIGYKGPEFYPGDPKKTPVKKINWNDRMYQKWIKDMASGGGARHAFDMAQNAKHEPGLIDFVKRKKTNGESPLERIQWDIENYA